MQSIYYSHKMHYFPSKTLLPKKTSLICLNSVSNNVGHKPIITVPLITWSCGYFILHK